MRSFDIAEDTAAKVEAVHRVVGGLDDPYGLELLSTVHWVMTERHARNDRAIERETYAWNSRKRQFTPGQIALAADHLRRDGWAVDAHAVA